MNKIKNPRRKPFSLGYPRVRKDGERCDGREYTRGRDGDPVMIYWYELGGS